MYIKKQRSRRKRKKRSPFTVKILVLVFIVLSGLSLVGGYFYLNANGHFDQKTANNSHRSFVNGDSTAAGFGAGTLHASNNTDELTQIDDASSQKNGKWLGLCKKASIHNLADFRASVESDPVLSQYYAGFNWEEAKMGNLKDDVLAYVAHRKDSVIKKTSKPIKLPKGDGFITDGKRTARTYCCNDIVITPSAGNPPPDLPVIPGAGPSSEIYPSASTTFSSIPLTSLPVDRLGSTDSDDSNRKSDSSTPVPEPATMLLFGTGLIGLASILRRKNA